MCVCVCMYVSMCVCVFINPMSTKYAVFFPNTVKCFDENLGR